MQDVWPADAVIVFLSIEISSFARRVWVFFLFLMCLVLLNPFLGG